VGKVLDILRNSDDKGKLLERVLERLLSDLGFDNVRRQQSGTQFGFDVMAVRRSQTDEREEVWKFECKNLSGPITVNDIAPKLIWYFGRNVMDRFVIVGTSELSNDLHYLLSNHTFSMPIVVWAGNHLERLILSSRGAMELLGLPAETNAVLREREFEPVRYLPQSVTFDVFHELDPPFRFDYFLQGDEVTKAYTQQEFRLGAVLTNNSNRPVDVHAFEVITLDFQHIETRVLRLAKMKGLYKPIELVFNPSTRVGGVSGILGPFAWRVESQNQEMIRLTLDEDSQPGLYRIMFRVSFTEGTELIKLHSPSFLLRVGDSTDDVLTLHVFRHYDSAAEYVLRLEESKWRLLKGRTSAGDSIVFLGPSSYEISKRIEDSTWIIREIAGVPLTDGRPGIEISYGQPSTILLNLGVPVEEDLYSLADAIGRVSGQDRWQSLLPKQMERRKTSKS
jgi:hypothetical protein